MYKELPSKVPTVVLVVRSRSGILDPGCLEVFAHNGYVKIAKYYHILSTWLEKPRKINHYIQRLSDVNLRCFLSLHAWKLQHTTSLINPLSQALYHPRSGHQPHHLGWATALKICYFQSCTPGIETYLFQFSSLQNFPCLQKKKKKTLDIPLLLRKKRQKNYFFHKEANGHSKHKMLDFVSMVNKTCLATR